MSEEYAKTIPLTPEEIATAVNNAYDYLDALRYAKPTGDPGRILRALLIRLEQAERGVPVLVPDQSKEIFDLRDELFETKIERDRYKDQVNALLRENEETDKLICKVNLLEEMLTKFSYVAQSTFAREYLQKEDS